ncbi:TIGR00730 family Rossman fold protein [Aquimarina sp. W85]|uniref:LOG family protein n=1 Tax=Aquimarina rhodophyticola TaxID=3342246 RepID=UPI0036727BF4
MTLLNSVAVFCGSSEGNDPQIINEAKLLGGLLAEEKIRIVYGGAKIGIMGEVAQSALNSGGNVIGVLPRFLKRKEVAHLGLTELITVDTMHQRKLKMHELSDGFIALPGGFGTLEELFEILTWGQLGLHKKPIGLLNVNGFYDDLLALLKKMVHKGFLKPDNHELILVDKSVSNLLQKMKSHTSKQTPAWLTPDKM